MKMAYYASISLSIVLPILGVGIGQGIINRSALAAIARQPSAHKVISRLMIIALSLNETAVLLSLLLGILLFKAQAAISTVSTLAAYGALAAIALPGFLVGIAAAFPTKWLLSATARQPFLSAQATTLLLITQTFLQTPLVFGFVMGMLIWGQLSDTSTITEGLRLLSAGLTIGIGSIGPTVGLSLFAIQACSALGINKTSYNQVRVFALLSQALIEAQIIITLVASLFMLTTTTSTHGLPFLAAAFTMGVSTLGTGISSGRTAAQACEQIIQKPEVYTVLSRLSLGTQTLIETCVIYGLATALFIVYYCTT
jgi:F-type H+-transporting ATPase subunit c